MSSLYTLNYPATYDDYTSLGANAALNNATTTLTGSLSSGATVASVDDTSLFNNEGKVVIEGEIIHYTGKTATSFTGLSRAREGTVAAEHAANTDVAALITARDQTILADAIMAIEPTIERCVVLDQDFGKSGGAAKSTIKGSPDIPLGFSVPGSTSYALEVVLYVSASLSGGSLFCLNGTATASWLRANVEMLDLATGSLAIPSISVTGIITALNSTISQIGATSARVLIRGGIEINTAGTLNIEFAQAANSGTSTVLKGSYVTLKRQTIT